MAQALSESISAALKADIAGKGGGAASFGRSSAEAVAQLGERLATIQLLRDGLYRACEAYANGAMSSTSYAMILARYDNSMVTLLMGELAAGAFGRSGAMISAGAAGAAHAGVSGDAEALLNDMNEKEEALDKANTKLKEEKDTLANLNAATTKDATAISAQEKKVTAAEKDRYTAQENFELAQDVYRKLGGAGVSTSARAGGNQALGAIAVTANKGVEAAKVLQAMNQNYLDDNRRDQTPLISACISTLDRVTVSYTDLTTLTELKKRLGASERDLGTEEDKLADLKKTKALNQSAISDQQKIVDERTEDRNKSQSKLHAESEKVDKKFSRAGLSQFAIICRTEIMPLVVAKMKAGPALAAKEIDRDKAKAEAAKAKAEKEKIEVSKAVTKDVQKAASDAKDTLKTLNTTIEAVRLKSRMDVCRQALAGNASATDKLQLVTKCLENL